MCLTLSHPASADDTPPGPGAAADAGDKPWAHVDPNDERRAMEEFERGNALFDQSKYAAALTSFRRALKHWDHPSIRFNIANCLIHMGRSLEGLTELEASMRYGPTPLGAKVFATGKTFEVMLHRQLARLAVRCDQRGARVSIDGEHVLDCPGSHERWVDPGPHQILARKPGFVPFDRSIDARSGARVAVVTELARPMEVIQGEEIRRWPEWLPWTILGGGAAIAAAGIPVLALSENNFEEFRDGVATECPMGCSNDGLSDGVLDKRSRARTQRALAITTYSVGAAVAVAGAVMLYLNRPQKTQERVTVGVGPRSAAVRISF